MAREKKWEKWAASRVSNVTTELRTRLTGKFGEKKSGFSFLPSHPAHTHLRSLSLSDVEEKLLTSFYKYDSFREL